MIFPYSGDVEPVRGFNPCTGSHVCDRGLFEYHHFRLFENSVIYITIILDRNTGTLHHILLKEIFSYKIINPYIATGIDRPKEELSKEFDFDLLKE